MPLVDGRRIGECYRYYTMGVFFGDRPPLCSLFRTAALYISSTILPAESMASRRLDSRCVPSSGYAPSRAKLLALNPERAAR